MDITIRRARDDELEDVGELTARAYLDDGLLDFGEDDTYLKELRAARHRAQHTELLVAVDNASGTVLGGVAFVGDGGEYADIAGAGEGEFRMLAVRPEGRGRGVGEALVRACVERARERGFIRTPQRDWQPYPEMSPLRAFALEL